MLPPGGGHMPQLHDINQRLLTFCVPWMKHNAWDSKENQFDCSTIIQIKKKTVI